MNQVPIRVRLTLAFAVAIAVVLAVGGFLLYERLGASLDGTLDQGLQARAAQLAGLLKPNDPGLEEAPPAPVSSASGSFAQVLDAQGRVHDETRGLNGRPLLRGAALAAARRSPLLVRRTPVSGSDARLLAVPLQGSGRPFVLIVGAPLRARDEALATLRQELLTGGPIALALVSLIGYLVAAAALRPVERMRSRAASIGRQHLAERLPVPPSHDEIARLGTTLNEMLARTERSVKRERSFVADASHELRAPLALIRAEVELALEAPRTSSDLVAALQSIGEEADRLSQLSDDLLLLARFDEGQLALREEAVDVDVVLHDVAERFRRRAADDGREIKVSAPALRVTGDRVRLEQAIINLVENALRHGGGTVHLDACEHGDRIEIHVSDEGLGFSADIATIAFDRFARADSARSSTGTGLGLSIVKAIVDAHGGTVALAAPRQGADVVVVLPPARVSRPLRSLPPASAPEQSPS